jgi:glucokinase
VSTLTIGVDVGGTKVLGGVVDEDGVVLTQARRDTPADNVGRTLDSIVEVIDELAAVHDVAGVGVGAAGWIDADRSRVLFAPNLAWRDEPLRDKLSGRTHLPVVVENDGNAAAWAEFRFGAARDARTSMVLVTLGTGVGGGFVVDGELLHGVHGMAAEPGHITVVRDGRPCPCGRHGCLEQYASGTALVRAARSRADADPAQAMLLLELAGGSVDKINGRQVTQAALSGDPASRASFEEIAGWLGVGLASLVHVLDPEILVIGGGVVEAGELLLEPLRVAYAGQLGSRGPLPHAGVVAASLGNYAGVVGAADLARH